MYVELRLKLALCDCVNYLVVVLWLFCTNYLVVYVVYVYEIMLFFVVFSRAFYADVYALR